MDKQVPLPKVDETLPSGYQRRLARGILVGDEVLGEQVDLDGVHVKEIRFKVPTEDKPEFTAIVKAVVDGQVIVGFHNADTFSECVLGALARLSNRAMKWREDRPFPG